MTKLLYNRADVRAELYVVINDVQRMKEQHRQAWTESEEGHKEPCQVCARYDAQKTGVRRTIRHFGGKPRG